MTSYTTAHDHVRAAKGKPTEYRCQCGNQATEWAYDHLDPEERYALVHDGKYAVPYSTDVAHYVALCTKCHRDLDLHRKGKDDQAELRDPYAYSYEQGVLFGDCE